LFLEGPFTVLAPTDAAFAEIPPKDLEALLHDKPKLTAVLLRHVIAGKVGRIILESLNNLFLSVNCLRLKTAFHKKIFTFKILIY
jgi:uncharacterized surface protein with fasciclin (FAS1) repeats